MMEQKIIDALNDLLSAAIAYGAELGNEGWRWRDAAKRRDSATYEFAKLTGLDFEDKEAFGFIKFKKRGEQNAS